MSSQKTSLRHGLLCGSALLQAGQPAVFLADNALRVRFFPGAWHAVAEPVGFAKREEAVLSRREFPQRDTFAHAASRPATLYAKFGIRTVDVVGATAPLVVLSPLVLVKGLAVAGALLARGGGR